MVYQILFRSLELFSIHQKSQITDELVDHLAEPKNDSRLFRGEGRTPTEVAWVRVKDFGGGASIILGWEVCPLLY